MRRRSLLLGGLLSLGARDALARVSLSSVGPINNSASLTPTVHISYGQSWRVNNFADFGTFGINPKGSLALRVSSIGTPTFLPGPLTNSAGISLTGSIVGVQNYASTDTFAIGRCAITAMQGLRLAAGMTVSPIIEFCSGYPASTWTSGGGGGLSPGSTFTASVTNDLMTVTSVSDGVLSVGQSLVVAGLTSGTAILAFGTGTGGTGTYTIGIPQTVLSETMTATGVGSATFVGSIGGGIPNTTLTVTSVSSCTLAVGPTIHGTSVLAGTTIASLGTGSGGVGTYNLEVGSPQSISSSVISGQNTSWTHMLTILSQTNALVPPKLDVNGGILKLLPPRYTSFGYTQGGATDATQASKLQDLTDMYADFDALGLSGGPLKGYFGFPAAISSAQTTNVSSYGTVVFCQTNAPGAGGPLSGRVYFSSCSYPWPFNGADNIHTNNYGTTRWGEWEGYVKHLVEDLGVQFTPLWVLSTPVSVEGQNVIVTFDRPNSPDFTDAVLSWESDPNDGIKVWPQYGFSVKRGGVDLTVTPVLHGNGTKVTLQIAEHLVKGDSLEVSYCWYGPGGPDPGPNSGVGGNLVMVGPTSILYPNGYQGTPKTLDAWAVPFNQTVTV